MKMVIHDVLHYPGREPHPPRKIIPVVLLHASAARKVFETYNYDPFGHLDAGNENATRRFLMDKTVLKVQLEYVREDVECHNVGAIIPVDFTHPEEDTERFFRIGDHFSFHKNGIPVIFFEDGGTADLHKITDDPEKIDFAKLQRVSQLASALVMELGNTDDNLPGQPGQ